MTSSLFLLCFNCSLLFQEYQPWITVCLNLSFCSVSFSNCIECSLPQSDNSHSCFTSTFDIDSIKPEDSGIISFIVANSKGLDDVELTLNVTRASFSVSRGKKNYADFFSSWLRNKRRNYQDFSKKAEESTSRERGPFYVQFPLIPRNSLPFHTRKSLFSLILWKVPAHHENDDVPVGLHFLDFRLQTIVENNDPKLYLRLLLFSIEERRKLTHPTSSSSLLSSRSCCSLSICRVLLDFILFWTSFSKLDIQRSSSCAPTHSSLVFLHGTHRYSCLSSRFCFPCISSNIISCDSNYEMQTQLQLQKHVVSCFLGMRLTSLCWWSWLR